MEWWRIREALGAWAVRVFAYVRHSVTSTMVLIPSFVLLVVLAVVFGYHLNNTPTNPSAAVIKTIKKPVSQPSNLVPAAPDPLATVSADLTRLLLHKQQFQLL